MRFDAQLRWLQNGTQNTKNPRGEATNAIAAGYEQQRRVDAVHDELRQQVRLLPNRRNAPRAARSTSPARSSAPTVPRKTPCSPAAGSSTDYSRTPNSAVKAPAGIHGYHGYRIAQRARHEEQSEQQRNDLRRHHFPTGNRGNRPYRRKLRPVRNGDCRKPRNRRSRELRETPLPAETPPRGARRGKPRRRSPRVPRFSGGPRRGAAARRGRVRTSRWEDSRGETLRKAR